MVELKDCQKVWLRPEWCKQRLLDWWWPQGSEAPGMEVIMVELLCLEALVWRVHHQDGRCVCPWLVLAPSF